MNAGEKSLGERIVEIARLATAMHIESAISRQPVVTDSESQRSEVGGAGPWVAFCGAHRFRDEANRFTDEADRRRDAANDRPHGAVADSQATPQEGAGGEPT